MFCRALLSQDSEDTGGLLQEDWSLPEPETAEVGKLEALAILPSTRILEICAECQIAASEVPASNDSALQSGASPAGGESRLSKTDKHVLSLLFTIPLILVLIGLLYRFCQEPLEQGPDVLAEATLNRKETVKAKKKYEKSIDASKLRSGCAAASTSKNREVDRSGKTVEAASFAGLGAAKGGLRAAAFSRKAKSAKSEISDSSQEESSKESSSTSCSDEKSENSSESSREKSVDDESSEHDDASASSSSPERPFATEQKGGKGRAATSRAGCGRTARTQRSKNREAHSESTNSAFEAGSKSESSEAESDRNRSSARSKCSSDAETPDKEKSRKRPMQMRPTTRNGSDDTAQPAEPINCECASAADTGSQARHFLQLATQYAAANATTFSCAYAAVVAAESTQDGPSTSASSEAMAATAIDIPTTQEPMEKASQSKGSFMGVSVSTARL
eukprot:4574460-Pleurochrysis_carterae.AAC.1